jgi:AcrR family transcriptional regulator
MSVRGVSRPNDARAHRSRRLLRQGLLDLIQTKSFEQVSLREITLAAGLSYPTFFRNYGSKEDLLGDIAVQEVGQLLSLMIAKLEDDDPKVSAIAICRYVDERRELWRSLLAKGAIDVMRDKFIELAKEFVRERGQINEIVPVDLATSFTSGALFEMLSWWLRQPEGYSFERIAYCIEHLVLRPTTTRHAE